ncbi:hypothetical protein PF005_g5468 [Phytophthora fragariae]|uniref:Aminotransferase class I/classII large domain-containing protein n=1 Tax=Phytophthora fragariae TaxID=53985 RepID=A0A6A4A6W8_9STRA|nr:hypothetical protein PF009_g4902 [Phytophthora fragariae]KAE9022998.1 hypothetical protein PF011_g4202 [Phytophthora fragariae]KAE9127954.1 hypothetical protein PF007_g5444 [Phytophthora fragariae]KAE9137567.1 hypothetical protein PF010_g1283 [Phytophthora fragariae]KAE9151028.1 hypothetical protein PF006_g4652 [Phytophthora fragariae]
MAALLRRWCPRNVLNARGPRTPWQVTEISRSLHSRSDLPPVKSVQSSPYAQTHTTSSVINFGLGQPSASLLPLDAFHDAAIARFKPTQDPLVLQYGAARGFIGFREEIAKLVAGANAVDPETLMVTAGNSQAISHAAMVFSKTNKRVFVEEPTYFLAHDIFRELGLELKGIHAGEDGIDLDVLEDRLAAGDVPAFLYTIPFFHNPTGAMMSPERCKRLVALAQNFSKILAPGLRLGWAQSSKDTIETLSTIAALRSGGGQNPVTAALVHSVLEQDLLLPHIDHLKSVFRARKDAMCDALREYCPEVAFTEPTGGYFVWLHLPDGVNADVLLKESVARHGVAFTPGTRCSLGTLYGDGDGGVPSSEAMMRCARISFAFYDEVEIRTGVQRLRNALDSLK